MRRILVIAKAPVPGLAKTRLCPPATPEQAADIAAAALLDTLDAVRAVAHPVVALTGSLAEASRAAELRAALRDATVFEQRGDTFADRLSAAHHDSFWHQNTPVLQIGMDTPQVTPELLAESYDALTGVDAVLGPASDGGWWCLGVHDPRHAEALRTVPMSTPDTGKLTWRALTEQGLRVRALPELSDVDTMADAARVAAGAPHGRFAAAVTAAAGAVLS